MAFGATDPPGLPPCTAEAPGAKDRAWPGAAETPGRPLGEFETGERKCCGGRFEGTADGAFGDTGVAIDGARERVGDFYTGVERQKSGAQISRRTSGCSTCSQSPQPPSTPERGLCECVGECGFGVSAR